LDLVNDNTLAVERDDKRLENGEHLRTVLTGALNDSLPRLARHALLIAGSH
jgi:hypothetical protein